MCSCPLRQIQCLHPSSFSDVFGYCSLFSVCSRYFKIALSHVPPIDSPPFLILPLSTSPEKINEPVSLASPRLVQTVRGVDICYKRSFLKCSREESHSCLSLASWQGWAVVWITIGLWIFCSKTFLWLDIQSLQSHPSHFVLHSELRGKS